MQAKQYDNARKAFVYREKTASLSGHDVLAMQRASCHPSSCVEMSDAYSALANSKRSALSESTALFP